MNCHSERSEESRIHQVNVFEILPPFGRLNDIFYIANYFKNHLIILAFSDIICKLVRFFESNADYYGHDRFSS